MLLKQTPPPKAVKKATPAKAAKAAPAIKNGAAKKAESEDDDDDDSGEFLKPDRCIHFLTHDLNVNWALIHPVLWNLFNVI